MLNDVVIGSFTIGVGRPPLIIAEMSGNHNQSLDRALELVDIAAKAGAHALKIQTYTADTMTLDIETGDFFISDPKSLWDGTSLYRLYQTAQTPYDWHRPIFERCRMHGMIGFSSPFDNSAVDFLEELDVPCYKIASFENTDLPLIRKVAATGKPLIISTGMASIAELDEAVMAAREAGAKDIILLKCTSSYPSTPENTNLRTIPVMQAMFDCHVGLSDHTMGLGAAAAAVALGATVIEKHFTTARADGGVDSAFSLEPHELRDLVIETERAALALGESAFGPTLAECKSLQFRRTLYIAEDMEAGEILTDRNLRRVRPGGGLPPKFLEMLMGRRVARAVKKGTPASWDLLTKAE